MANAHFPDPSAPDPIAARSSIAADATTCLGCGQSVDPLRAGHVAVLEGRFRYFCRAGCKQDYLRAHGRPLEEEVATATPPEVARINVRSSSGALLDVGRSDRPAERPEPLPALVPAPRATLPSGAIPPRRAARKGWDAALPFVEIAGIGMGAFVPAIELLGAVADALRVPLVIGAWTALALRFGLTARDPSDPHPAVVLGPTAGALIAACWARSEHDPRAVSIAMLAGLGCAVAIVVEMVVARSRARVLAARERVERALDVRVRVIHGEDTIALPASEVRAGEQILVEAGELIGVDAIVTAGEARVVPWLDATVEVVRGEGDPVVAGARVASNRLRMTTTWSGRERAWVRLLSVPSARIDVAAPTARTLRRVIERGSPLAAGLVGVAALAANATPVEILATMSAAAMAFGVKAASSLVAVHFARAHLEALSSGITYKDPSAFERAGATNVAVLSARGTVLMGEPEIVAIVAIGPLAGRKEAPGGIDDAARVLSLAAGAETASTHPFAAAILRAARARGVAADHVRNAMVHDGLGVTALASTGERLVVGGRAIMLEEKIGVAVADPRITELEAQGRSVLLVALGDRLVGLIALQDGLRPGARAAVQKLLDARVEPVLMSGEARDTCETIGRALDIEHVRPEVLPADRGSEVRALAEGGSVVAVIGHPARDDGALGAAEVAVAMGAAGSTPGEWAVALASDDVRDAARAVAIARATRDRVRASIALGATPGFVALLAIAFGVAPLAVAPLAVLAGAAAAAVHARESAARAIAP
jgi:cation transport ATPase